MSEKELEFERIGSIDRYSGTFTPKKKWQGKIPEVSFDLPKVLDLIEEKLRFNIIGEFNDKAIFLNKSKSGKSLYFKFQERFFNIPIKGIIEFNGRWIGVFTTKE